MKAEKIFVYAVLSFVCMIISCTSEDKLEVNPINLNGTATIASEENRIDRYIRENFTSPYNIEIQYKW